MKIEVVGWC